MPEMQAHVYLTSLFAVAESLLREEGRRKERKRDHLGNLPPEMALFIFRYLRVTDLLTMMDVDAKWGVLIDSDPILRRRLTLAKSTLRKIPKENRDSNARKTLGKLRHHNTYVNYGFFNFTVSLMISCFR